MAKPGAAPHACPGPKAREQCRYAEVKYGRCSAERSHDGYWNRIGACRLGLVVDRFTGHWWHRKRAKGSRHTTRQGSALVQEDRLKGVGWQMWSCFLRPESPSRSPKLTNTRVEHRSENGREAVEGDGRSQLGGKAGASRDGLTRRAWTTTTAALPFADVLRTWVGSADFWELDQSEPEEFR